MTYFQLNEQNAVRLAKKIQARRKHLVIGYSSLPLPQPGDFIESLWGVHLRDTMLVVTGEGQRADYEQQSDVVQEIVGLRPTTDISLAVGFIRTRLLEK